MALSESSLGKGALWVGMSTDRTGTKRQTGDNTCWAACFAFITGQTGETLFQLYTSLDASISGIGSSDEASLTKEMGFVKCDPWFGGIATLGEKFGSQLPMAVALPVHFIVVTRVELNASRTNYTQVRFWDPATNAYETLSREDFIRLKKPFYGYIRKPDEGKGK